MIFGTVEAWGEGEEIYGGTSCSHAIKKYSETELFNFIMNAVDAGFDQFDTSPLYHNERELGEIFHKLDPPNPEDGYRTTNYRIISNRFRTKTYSFNIFWTLSLRFCNISYE